MATYNGEKFIEQQLRTILDQTLPPDEVIICDDGSKDNTVKLVQKFIQENDLSRKWKLIQNSENQGYIQNFIHAIALTSGDYIFLSDQDDIFYPEKFAVMVRFMERHEDCLLLNADFESIDASGEKVHSFRSKRRRQKAARKLTFDDWLYESCFPGFSMCFRESLKEDIIKADITHCYGHDILIGLLAVNRGGNYSINEILSGYRIHDHNTTGGTNVVNNYSMSYRTSQKKQELQEYSLLEQMLEDNRLSHIDVSFIERRKKDLCRRIKSLEEESLSKALGNFFICQCYPKNTLAGDILYIGKGKLK